MRWMAGDPLCLRGSVVGNFSRVMTNLRSPRGGFDEILIVWAIPAGDDATHAGNAYGRFK